jgi:lipoprotein-anchoring transpeptidase ErfK/SrfK
MPRRDLSNWDKFKSFFKPRSGVVRWLLIVGVFLLGFFVIASSVLVYADSRHRGEMFPTTTVLGVDITGMSRDEAIAAVNEQAVRPLMQPLTIQFRGKQWVLNPSELGLQIDVPQMVDKAYGMGWNDSVVERIYRRTFNRPKNITIDLEYSSSRDAILQKLDAIAAEINRDVRDASLDFNFQTGALKMHPSQDGIAMDVEASLAAVNAGLVSENRVIEPVVKITKPNVSSDDVKTVLVVDIMGHTLKWYNQDVLVDWFAVATGMPKYPTPLGKYYIIRKDPNPTWINPNVEWSKNMPPKIDPGPDNPLGVRALVTSAAGGTVLIHGTANLTPGLYSHGCIRMANASILKLFDNVSVGTPVFIWTSSPVPPPPPDQGPAVGPENPGLGDSGQSQSQGQ